MMEFGDEDDDKIPTPSHNDSEDENDDVPEFYWDILEVPLEISLSVGDLDQSLFKMMKTELLAGAANIRLHINQQDPDTIERRMDYFFGPTTPWMSLLKNRIVVGLQDTGKPNLEDLEIYEFLELLIMCHFFNLSPSVLTHPTVDIIRPLMSVDRFEVILKALASSKDVHSPRGIAVLMESLRNVVYLVGIWYYMESLILDGTITTMDQLLDPSKHRAASAFKLSLNALHKQFRHVALPTEDCSHHPQFHHHRSARVAEHEELLGVPNLPIQQQAPSPTVFIPPSSGRKKRTRAVLFDSQLGYNHRQACDPHGTFATIMEDPPTRRTRCFVCNKKCQTYCSRCDVHLHRNLCYERFHNEHDLTDTITYGARVVVGEEGG